MPQMLRLDVVHVHYGPTEAVRGITLSLAQGEIGALIGANGAGKSTTLAAISGVVPVSRGTITFDGHDLRSIRAQEIVRRGISQVPEGRRVFGELTVEENLAVGRFVRRRQRDDQDVYEKVFTLFPKLFERRGQRAETLSGGEQQMLAVGRALMSEPRLLMLDEPSLGLAPKMVDVIFEAILDISSLGVTVLIVEQNVSRTLEVAHIAWVLERGEITSTGTPDALLTDGRVLDAYLGSAKSAGSSNEKGKRS